MHVLSYFFKLMDQDNCTQILVSDFFSKEKFERVRVEGKSLSTQDFFKRNFIFF